MKTKIPILIAAAVFLAIVSKAQYGGGYGDNRLTIQGQVVIPGRAVFGYGYNNMDRDRYEEHREWRDDDYDRYDDHRDRRGDDYEHYCRDHREYRGDRREFYHHHYGYRDSPYWAPRRVVVYGY